MDGMGYVEIWLEKIRENNSLELHHPQSTNRLSILFFVILDLFQNLKKGARKLNQLLENALKRGSFWWWSFFSRVLSHCWKLSMFMFNRMRIYFFPECPQFITSLFQHVSLLKNEVLRCRSPWENDFQNVQSPDAWRPPKISTEDAPTVRLHDRLGLGICGMGGCQKPWFTVGKESIDVYQGTFINLHWLYCEAVFRHDPRYGNPSPAKIPAMFGQEKMKCQLMSWL